jgi:hypothetical protein
MKCFMILIYPWILNQSCASLMYSSTGVTGFYTIQDNHVKLLWRFFLIFFYSGNDVLFDFFFITKNI